MPSIHKIVVVATIEANSPTDAIWALIRGLAEGKIQANVEIQPRTQFTKHTTPNSPAKPMSWWPMGPSAQIMCDNGHSIYLDPYIHMIRSNGEVSPSVICGEDACSFHTFIQLNDWEEPKT